MHSRTLAFLVALGIVGTWLVLAGMLVVAVLINLSVNNSEGWFEPLMYGFVILGTMAAAGSLVARSEGSDRIRFPLLIGWERGRPGRFRAVLQEVGDALMWR